MAFLGIGSYPIRKVSGNFVALSPIKLEGRTSFLDNPKKSNEPTVKNISTGINEMKNIFLLTI
tara:strand:- start:4556 stop:4744 length:189 start_codon:yes stop_codon:yes gene_type:complete